MLESARGFSPGRREIAAGESDSYKAQVLRYKPIKTFQTFKQFQTLKKKARSNKAQPK
jgi:hypothetical protein